MNKALIAALAATVLTPAVASAQPWQDVRQDRQDVRHDRQDMRHDRQDMRRDMNRGDWRAARDDRQNMRDDRQNMRDDRRQMREEWRDYRDSHRDAFRMRPYVGPRGYAYRPVTPGFVFGPSYLSQRYWIANPGIYRLRPAGPGLRWIRYGNDVALVNVRTGRVIEIHNSFFW